METLYCAMLILVPEMDGGGEGGDGGGDRRRAGGVEGEGEEGGGRDKARPER